MMAPSETKVCCYCEERKPRTEFGPGKQRLCRSCAELKKKQAEKKAAYVAQSPGGKPRRWAGGW
jgi:hypothetical protein